MEEIKLIVQSPDGTEEVALVADRLTVGRGDQADVVTHDRGLSRLHASIYREGNRIWVLDEGSTNGSFVNGDPVPPAGTALADGDIITIGDETTLTVRIAGANEVAASPPQPGRSSRLPVVALAALVVALLAGVVLLGSRLIGGGRQPSRRVESANHDAAAVKSQAGETNSNRAAVEDTPLPNTPAVAASDPISSDQTFKLYRQMTPEEQLEFIDRRARHVSLMMSSREYAFTPETLAYIKEYVDSYARRAGNNSSALWGEDMRFLLKRASTLTPGIVRAFRQRGVPPVVGLYIAMIETEYRECLVSPVGAKGLFQFMPETARGYGVDPDDRCNVDKMAPAAARYIKDRVAEFGTDAMSVALGIAGYNRSPDSIRRDLHDVIDPANKERSFWTLIANKTELDHFFQKENVRYVPKFFAAAIVGETPKAFGIQMKPLSTYTEITDAQ